MLNWRNVTPSNSPKFLVTGTELNCAFAGKWCRYQICELRSYGKDGFADRTYVVRDAHANTDEAIRLGIRSPIVARYATLDEAEAYCRRNVTEN